MSKPTVTYSKTNDCPHIVVGTPGRILGLAREKSLQLDHIKHFVLDECDRGVLESLDMRRDMQEIFPMTPHEKTSHDVLCHPIQGNQARLQEVLSGSHGNLC